MRSETCPLRKRKGTCYHSVTTETRLDIYKWVHPRNRNFYMKYTKTIETCLLRKEAVNIKIEQSNDFSHKPTWWEMYWNA